MDPPRAVPERFAGYRILGEIGHGGMGVTYRAYDPELKREVALKVLLAAEHASQEQVDRFLREAESLARLRHPNIVPVHQRGVHRGIHYYVMDYIVGRPLSDLIREGELDVRRALELAEKIARALHYAHANGVVHRDLKPENVMVTPDGEPIVIDFGLAKLMVPEERGRTLTRTGVAVGTPEYEAPEQALGLNREVDARTDIYALGCILYEMLASVPPFVAANKYEVLRMHIEEDPVPLTRRGVKVSRDLDTICLKCLEKEPGRRYQTAAMLADDIRRFLDGEPIRARPPSVFYVARRKVVKHRALLAAAAVSVVVTAAALAAAMLYPRVRDLVRDRELLREALRRKRAREERFARLLAEGRYDEAISLGEEMFRARPAVPEGLSDPARLSEFPGLTTPYRVELARAYYLRGAGRLSRGDGRGLSDLANAYRAALEAGDRETGRAALLAMGAEMDRRGEGRAALALYRLCRERFGAAPAVEARLARALEREGSLEEALARWRSLAAGRKNGCQKSRTM